VESGSKKDGRASAEKKASYMDEMLQQMARANEQASPAKAVIKTDGKKKRATK
jgi:hypothetical protein